MKNDTVSRTSATGKIVISWATRWQDHGIIGAAEGCLLPYYVALVRPLAVPRAPAAALAIQITI